MQRFTLFALACSLAITFALSAACSSPTPPKTKKTLVFITNTGSDFWKIAQKGCEKADAELADVDVVFKTTFGGTVKEQERFISESQVKDDADAIAISPIDPVGMRDLLDKVAKKALLVTQDSDAPNTARALYIGADNRAAGRQAGEMIKKALPKGGKIMVFVGKRAENAQERLAGLREAVADSKIEIIDLMLDENDFMRAEENAETALNKYPDLAGMIGLWSYNGPAILRALKSASKVGQVKVVCFDDEPDTLKGIKEGSIYGTITQQPFEYGYQSVQLMSKILKGDKSVIPPDKKVLIPTIVVQSDNLDEYKKTHEQILGGGK